MQLTRRSFIGSSLAVGLAAAAEAAHADWLLRPENPVRIGILGLQSAAAEHLALFAAVPGAHIAGIVEHADAGRTESVVKGLQKLGQPIPVIYPNAGSMLDDQTLHAFSLASPLTSTALRALQGRAILTDFPHAKEQEKRQDLSISRAILSGNLTIRYRLEDFVYPSSLPEIKTWLEERQPKNARASLTVPMLRDPEAAWRAKVIALSGLLSAITQPDDLLTWAAGFLHNVRGHGPRHALALPQNRYGIQELAVQAFAANPLYSTFTIDAGNGAMTTTIASRPNPQTSLETAMKFLRDVRRRRFAQDQSAVFSSVAAVLVDHGSQKHKTRGAEII